MLDKNARRLKNSNSLMHKVKGKSLFETQMLNAWAEINSFDPITIKEIINQSISEIIYIRIEHKPIKNDYLGTYNKNILTVMKIKDVISIDWKIMTKNSLEQIVDDRISILSYMAIIKEIPKSLKDKIAKTDTELNIHTLVITDASRLYILIHG